MFGVGVAFIGVGPWRFLLFVMSDGSVFPVYTTVGFIVDVGILHTVRRIGRNFCHEL